jgi:signal recognition particle subunit SRP54
MGGMPGGIPKNSLSNKGLPAADDLQLEELKKQLGNMPGSGAGLPGLGGGKPRLPGIGGLPFGNKKK